MTNFYLPPEKERGEFEYKVAPAGTHVARCISFIDLGSHEDNFQGDITLKRKVRITWELPNELAVFKEENGEQPFLVSREYTFSLNEKASLYKMLSGWIGLSEKTKKTFDPQKDLLGQPCMVTINHVETKKGTIFPKVMNVSPLLKGADCPGQVNESTYFFMGWNGHHSEFDQDAFKKLPGFLQDKIAMTQEYDFGQTDSKSKDEAKNAKEVFGQGVKAEDLPF